MAAVVAALATGSSIIATDVNAATTARTTAAIAAVVMAVVAMAGKLPNKMSVMSLVQTIIDLLYTPQVVSIRVVMPMKSASIHIH